jgi:L-fuconolactonase
LEVIDAQLHAWEPDHPRRPWDPDYGATDVIEARNRAHHAAHPVTYQELLRRMDGAGVDAALLVTSAVYDDDNSYPLEAAAKHPQRFAVVGRLNPAAPALEQRVAGWRRAGLLGIRLIVGSDAEREAWRAGAYLPLLRACAEHAVPVCIFPPGMLTAVDQLAGALPGLTLVSDHLGLSQPPLMAADGDPFQRLPELLALARRPNVAVKLTAVPSLSRQAYPFADIWPSVRRVLAAFGPERVMWGSDNTRTAALHTYADALGYIRDSDELSAADRERILGGTLRRLFRWERGAGAALD